MPQRTLRFCQTCLATQQAAARETCRECGSTLIALLDENSALAREVLVARGSCCANGCRNCPYPKSESVGDERIGSAKTKTCERCGEGFECRSGECWCQGIQLSPGTLKWLGRTYADCLCPACLGGFSA